MFVRFNVVIISKDAFRDTGMKTIVTPCITSEKLSTVKRFIKAIEKPFQEIDTEYKLDSVLYNAKLMDHMQKCILSKEPVEDPLDDPHDDLLIESDEEESDSEENSLMLMPIKFKLQKFFELPNVYAKIDEHTKAIYREGKLNHFINGKIWKKKLQYFDETQTVIPYFLYFDGAQVNNPLGPHCRKGLLDFNYMTLPTIPTEYQSKLENIFVVSISPGNITKCPGLYIYYSRAMYTIFFVLNFYESNFKINKFRKI